MTQHPDSVSRVGLTKEELDLIEQWAGKGRLPSVEERARLAGWGVFYASYRGLSGKHHAGVAAAGIGIQQASGRAVVELQGTYLSLATRSVLELTGLVDATFKWGRAEAIYKAIEALRKATVADEETPLTGPA
jgi:hypothetical protein